MNYTQMFANGGKTSDQELIKGIQKILGVDDAQMEQLLQIGINKYGSLEGIGQALSQATQGLTQNSSPEEVQAAVASVFQTNAESQMFKCGGKLQQLVSRFGKGGPVDCGCGGIKINQRGGVADEGDLRQQGPFYNLQSLVYRNSDGKYMGPDGAAFTTSRIATNGGNQEYTVFHPDLQSQLNNNLNIQRYMWNPRIFPVHYPHTSTFRTDPNGNVSTLNPPRAISLADTEKYQEGGIVLEQLPGHDVNTNLTRRQARQLAAQNQGYNGEQFQFAIANAMNALRNQGLRGRELRERAREMAAGISPVQQSIVSAPAQLAGATETPEGFGNIVGIREGDLRPQTPIVQSIVAPAKPTTPAKPAKRGAVEVGNVSVNGIPSSAVGANSPVTPIKRKGLDGTAVSIDSGVWGIDGTPLGRLYTENIPEQPHVVRSGRDANGNYYEVSDGMAGIDINGNYYIKTITPPKKKTATPATVPAGGGSFSWMSFKCGGKVESDKCGGKPKAKKAECGVKLKPAMKCGGKTKKKIK